MFSPMEQAERAVEKLRYLADKALYENDNVDLWETLEDKADRYHAAIMRVKTRSAGPEDRKIFREAVAWRSMLDDEVHARKKAAGQ